MMFVYVAPRRRQATNVNFLYWEVGLRAAQLARCDVLLAVLDQFFEWRDVAVYEVRMTRRV